MKVFKVLGPILFIGRCDFKL